jgi:hypothetical protein
MKATAMPRTLYFDMKSKNSLQSPFGGGGGGGDGLGSSSVLISFKTCNISSSVLDITSPSNKINILLFNVIIINEFWRI